MTRYITASIVTVSFSHFQFWSLFCEKLQLQYYLNVLFKFLFAHLLLMLLNTASVQ